MSRSIWVPGLLIALCAACGPASSEDKYFGFVDASAFDGKFTGPSCTGGGNCYQPQVARAGGAVVNFYNLGLVPAAALGKDAQLRPVLKPSLTAPVAYDFPDGCVAGKEFDARTDAFRRDAQYPVLTALPLATTSTTAPPVLPVVRVTRWTGTGEVSCNAIKSAASVTKGTFGGAAEETPTPSLRAVIDGTLAVKPLTADLTYGAKSGWYNGLQLSYLDGGALTLDAEGNAVVIDAVLVHTQGATASRITDANAVVFSVAPGSVPNASSIARVYELTTPMGVQRTAYTGLCYVAPCAADQIDMTTLTKSTGLLFAFGG
ncbi:MAG: hypothetical protein ACT4TC_03320 [Myxococcaceae bacterium]